MSRICQLYLNEVTPIYPILKGKSLETLEKCSQKRVDMAAGVGSPLMFPSRTIQIDDIDLIIDSCRNDWKFKIDTTEVLKMNAMEKLIIFDSPRSRMMGNLYMKLVVPNAEQWLYEFINENKSRFPLSLLKGESFVKTEVVPGREQRTLGLYRKGKRLVQKGQWSFLRCHEVVRPTGNAQPEHAMNATTKTNGTGKKPTATTRQGDKEQSLVTLRD
jgi:hypothetical protein